MLGEQPYCPNRLYRNVGLVVGLGGVALAYIAERYGLPGLDAGHVDKIGEGAGVLLAVTGATALIANLSNDRY